MSAEMIDVMQAHLNWRDSHQRHISQRPFGYGRELVGFSRSHEEANRSRTMLQNCRLPDQPWSDVVLDTLEPPVRHGLMWKALLPMCFLEADVTTSVLQLYATAERENDVRSTVFLDGVIIRQSTKLPTCWDV